LAEYEVVSSRPRLKIAPSKVKIALAQIRAAGLFISPKTRVTAAVDPDDNIFLECAAAAKARYLVTGNQGDFPPEAWENVRIVTARHFLGDFADWQRGNPSA
jgi:predicted nucleic acid-binding protein